MSQKTPKTPEIAGGESDSEYFHRFLGCGAEFGVDRLPQRGTVAMLFRILGGVALDPLDKSGLGAIVERTLAKGTQKYTGRELADEFDKLGARWSSAIGRQSTLVRVLCLPEFALDVVDLVAEMLVHPTFPAEACEVAVELAQQDLKALADDPDSLLRLLSQRLTLGPVLGRHVGGDVESLARIGPADVAEYWKRHFHVGRLQVSAAGAVEPELLAQRIDRCFSGLGDSKVAGREAADFAFTPGTAYRHKDLEQEYMALTLPGVPKGHADFPAEQVLLAVLSGGMSGRLFTEVREKQGLVYWVAAWHEHPRGKGLINLGASTTPERCERTYQTLLRELERLSEDLTEAETRRARDSLIAQSLTEDDLTAARASSLSDDLFHFGRPIGLAAKLEQIAAVSVAQVEDYVRRMPRDQICLAALGPKEMGRGV